MAYKGKDGREYEYQPVDYYDRTDLGADEMFMSPEDLAASELTKKKFAVAQAAGDQAGMDAAHQEQEDRRAKYGYSGGANGGAYNKLAGAKAGGVLGLGGGGTFSYREAPTYVNQYQDLIDGMWKKIMGREPFQYDPESDPLYGQYKEQYTRNGERAMEDTLGQVSARTGGLASSYAGGAAQGAYQQYMAALNDKIPELEQLAWEKYRAEGQDQRADLEMLMALEQGEYGKFMDQLGQYNTDRSFDLGVFQDRRDYGRRVYEDQRDFSHTLEREQVEDERIAADTAYKREQDKREQDLTAGEWLYGMIGDPELLAGTLGLTEEKAKMLVDKYAEDQNKTREQAAQELAALYANYGDFSKLKELGVDTTALERQQAMSLTPRSSGGGGGGSGDESGGEWSRDFEDVKKKALKYEDPEEAKRYLERMVDAENVSLTADEAAYIYQVLLGGEVGEIEGTEPKEKEWGKGLYPGASLDAFIGGTAGELLMDMLKRKY